MGRIILFLMMLLPVLASAVEVTPLLDLRVRQELLDGVLHFAPDPSANWIRMRTRAGVRTVAGAHRLELRLANEHRHYLHPDTDFEWNEVIIDRALWAWTPDDATTLTAGRQNIIWPGGFLMLEGHPYDGSRSIYQNAVRLQHGSLDLAFIRNLKHDQWVLINDLQRPLQDMDETGIVLRSEHGGLSWAAIYKDESDPDLVLADLVTGTLGARYERDGDDGGRLEAELAVQFLRQKSGGDDGHQDATALAAQVFLTEPVGGGVRLEAGGFYYSGNSDKDWAGFRAPWGRWPKWSELYIYTLIGESTPGRVTVAAWENIAAPRLQCHIPVGTNLDGRCGLTYLLAPEPDWEPRGLLTQAELKADLGGGLKGHLLWEMLVPGSFHDGRHNLAPLTDTVHFLRWQISWAL